MPLEPREYQSRGISLARQEFAKGVKRMIIVAPTGAGKTFLASLIVESHLARNPNNRALFLAYGRELILQSSRTFDDYGIGNGVLMAGIEPIPEYRVQVASIDTLVSRSVRSSRMKLPKSTLVVSDEAHRSAANKWQTVLTLYPDAFHVGLTATPIRGDGRSLYNAGWQSLVNITTYAELMDLGFIVPVRVFAPDAPNLKGVKTTAGDYNKAQLQERMDKVQLVGDIFSHWQKHASDRQTVIFASGVRHSMHIRDEFASHGIKIEHIDGNTPQDERDRIVDDLAAGRIQCITNYGCLREGWDCPRCSCIILAQPTKQFGTYRQMVGRILRPFEGKKDSIILDHAGAVHRHGWPTDDVPWTLEPDANIQERQEAKRKSKPDREPITCHMCHAVRQGGRECPNCGFQAQLKGKAANIATGTLTEIQRENNLKILREGANGKTAKKAFWDHCIGICIQNNWPIKRASGMYKQRFGVWPRGFENMPRGKDEFQMPARDWYQVLVQRQEVVT